MKWSRLASLLLLGLAVLSGCATNYKVTLNNGRTVTAVSKPRLDKAKNRYVFKVSSGEQVEVSPLMVREISPASAKGKANDFGSTSVQ